MALAENNLNEIKNRIINAYKNEEPVLKKFREYAKRLKNEVKAIRPYSVNAVSFVSSDGGDNRLYFNPSVIELVRVVDSRGVQCALDAISGNSKAVDFNERIQQGSHVLVKPLQRLCTDLGMTLLELSYLLEGIEKPGGSTGAVRVYRDIIEWAVLYDLIHKDWGSDTIIVREGMLRTKSFKRSVFPLIDQLIRNAYYKHKEGNITVSMVGVAKQSAVLSLLSVALELEDALNKPYPCYVEVPDDIEKDCYNYNKTWLETHDTAIPDEEGNYMYQSMGKLFLVKFGNRLFDPIWPVDIAEWQMGDAAQIIGQLAKDAQPGFPIPDFPMCIQKAHDFAKVNGMEVEILQDFLLQGICQNLSEEEKSKIFKIKYLGQNLTNIRYRNA